MKNKGVLKKRRNLKATLSLVVLLLCFVFLVGSTLAWFTDTAAVSGNKIFAGNLYADVVSLDADFEAKYDVVDLGNNLYNFKYKDTENYVTDPSTGQNSVVEKIERKVIDSENIESSEYYYVLTDVEAPFITLYNVEPGQAYPISLDVMNTGDLAISYTAGFSISKDSDNNPRSYTGLETLEKQASGNFEVYSNSYQVNDESISNNRTDGVVSFDKLSNDPTNTSAYEEYIKRKTKLEKMQSSNGVDIGGHLEDVLEVYAIDKDSRDENGNPTRAALKESNYIGTVKQMIDLFDPTVENTPELLAVEEKIMDVSYGYCLPPETIQDPENENRIKKEGITTYVYDTSTSLIIRIVNNVSELGKLDFIIYMPEDASSIYQNASLFLDLGVTATQVEFEYDGLECMVYDMKGEPAAPIDISTAPIFFTLDADKPYLRLSFSKPDLLEYSLDLNLGESGWSDFGPSSDVNLEGEGSKIYFRAKDNGGNASLNGGRFITNGSATFSVTGNLMGLLAHSDFDSITKCSDLTEKGYYAAEGNTFAGLFYGTNVSDASQLLLPSDPPEGAFKEMFLGCTYLNEGPTFTFQNINKDTCNSMFKDCSRLKHASSFPNDIITSVGEKGCFSMFEGCSSLTNMPIIDVGSYTNGGGASADYYFDGIFSRMFYGCSSLITGSSITYNGDVPTHAFTSMFENCIRLETLGDINVGNISSEAFYNFIKNANSIRTVGNLTFGNVPANEFKQFFKGRSNLSSVGNIIAGTVGNYGFSEMFSGCSSLTKTPGLITDNIGSYGCKNMYNGCNNLTTVSDIKVGNIGYAAFASLFENKTFLTTCSEFTFNNVDQYGCQKMFKNTKLVNGPTLNFNNTSVGSYAFQNAFSDLQTLTSCTLSGTLTNVGSYAFDSMFANDTLLNTTPNFNVKSFASGSSYNLNKMFYNCPAITSISSIFDSSISFITQYACNEMFSLCTNLTIPDTVIDTLLPATTIDKYGYNRMFYKCSSITSAPKLSGTTIYKRCYYEMFRDCTSIVNGPEICADSGGVIFETEQSQHFGYMLYGCYALKNIKLHFTDWPTPPVASGPNHMEVVRDNVSTLYWLPMSTTNQYYTYYTPSNKLTVYIPSSVELYWNRTDSLRKKEVAYLSRLNSSSGKYAAPFYLPQFDSFFEDTTDDCATIVPY